MRLRIDVEDRGGNIELLLPYATIEPIRNVLLQMFMGEKFGRDPIWEGHFATEVAQAEIEIDQSQIDITSSLTAALLERYHQNVINSAVTNQGRGIPPTHTGHCLHQVPEFILGGDKSAPRKVAVLLPEAVKYNVGTWDGRQEKDRKLRWIDTGNVGTPSILSQTTVSNFTAAATSKIVVVKKVKSKANGWER
ncbi:flagellar motor switch protein FliM [mine drainage metagenome]|uniref:Flagellar motor switch protein FliM n=1 Tax=mine drainage metagenome TaxID=410659 RepID=A0A1J5PP04_9ZZZZ